MTAIDCIDRLRVLLVAINIFIGHSVSCCPTTRPRGSVV